MVVLHSVVSKAILRARTSSFQMIQSSNDDDVENDGEKNPKQQGDTDLS